MPVKKGLKIINADFISIRQVAFRHAHRGVESHDH
jgi:hypothetical protein